MSQTKWMTFFAAAVLSISVTAPAFAQKPDAAPDKAEMQKRIKTLRHKMLVKKVALSED